MLATPIVIAGISLAVLFNPWWISPAQARAGVPAITGYPIAEMARVTDALIRDVTLGPPEFSVMAAGAPVLDAAERGHMQDVYSVLRLFSAAVVIAVVTLAVTGIRHQRSPRWWRSVGRAALVTAVTGLTIGVAFAVFFDAAWEAFHLVFFPGGNYAFDPSVERLTQLFPVGFWMDAVRTVFAVGLAVALAVWLSTSAIARSLESARPAQRT
jgi:integral membrane protein (TIGR01906 family)